MNSPTQLTPTTKKLDTQRQRFVGLVVVPSTHLVSLCLASSNTLPTRLADDGLYV
jgi:hypothetical protein